MIFNRQFLFNNLWWGENLRGKNTEWQLHIPHDVTASLVQPDTSRVWGLDISPWDGPTDLATAKSKGCSFVIIKGCDGSVPSRYFQENKQRAKAIELPWGMYCWLYPGSKVSISAQVSAWWNLVKDDYPPLGVWVDVEWTNYMGVPANPTSADANTALDKFLVVSGKKAGIYTARGYSDQYLIGFKKYDEFGLWVAHYGVNNPLLPVGATTYKFHQFTSTLDGSIAPNQKLGLDGNYYRGTREQFEQEYGLSIPEPETDVISFPFPNVKVTNGRRFGTDIQVVEIPASSIASVRACVTPDDQGLYAEDISGDIRVNGGDFDMTTFKPVGLLISDGITYSYQSDFEPAIGYLPDGRAEISHLKTDWENAIGLKRYLVINGKINPTTSDAWNIKEPRTIYIVKQDGTTMILTAKGRETNQAGLTLFECVNIILEFGGWNAGDGDGGNSTQIRIGDDLFQGTPYRRKVADLFSFKIIGGSMTTGTAKEKLGKSVSIRNAPRASASLTGASILPYSTIEFLEVVDDLDHPASADYKWLKLAENKYANYIYPPNGLRFIILTQPSTDPPPSADIVTVTQMLTFTDKEGVTWAGTSITTLTKQ